MRGDRSCAYGPKASHTLTQGPGNGARIGRSSFSESSTENSRAAGKLLHFGIGTQSFEFRVGNSDLVAREISSVRLSSAISSAESDAHQAMLPVKAPFFCSQESPAALSTSLFARHCGRNSSVAGALTRRKSAKEYFECDRRFWDIIFREGPTAYSLGGVPATG